MGGDGDLRIGAPSNERCAGIGDGGGLCILMERRGEGGGE